jgi:O-antigen/teichoic acid export membrane protein
VVLLVRVDGGVVTPILPDQGHRLQRSETYDTSSNGRIAKAMIQRKKIFRNAGAATVQVVVSGLVMFGLYRYLIATLGVERLGIWSVVLATTSASRITELGLTGSVVPFVAKYLAHDDHRNASDTVQTAVLSLGAFVGFVLVATYLPSLWILSRVLPAAAIPQADALLPYALASLWITTMSGVFLSALDGCQRTDMRALFNMGSSVLTLLASMLLVPNFGLLGLAYGQLGLAGILLVASWICVKRELTALPCIPFRWNKASFKEMIHYGANFQIITFVAISFDPVTKALLSRFGGLATVGYYEMARSMLYQFRSLLTSPNQVLVPVVAGLQEFEPHRIQNVYRDSYRLQAFLSLPLYAGILSLIPEISRLWIGSYEKTFVLYVLLLTLGWFLNGLINPAYFSNLGIGKLKWNTIAHVLIGALNVLLGVLLGIEFGAIGVVIGWVLALVLGSSVVLIAFHIENRIPLSDIFPRENAGLMVACAAGIAIAWLAYLRLQVHVNIIWTAIVCSLAFLGAIAIPVWKHPMRARLFGMLSGS